MSVLIAVVSGLGSGAMAAWWTTRSDRRERFRDRLIGAADDFVGAAAEALLTTRDAVSEVLSARGSEQIAAAIESAWRQRDTALHRSARVDLLFGPTNNPPICANEVLHELANSLELLSFPEPDADAAERASMKAAAALRRFHEAAAHAIQKRNPTRTHVGPFAFVGKMK